MRGSFSKESAETLRSSLSSQANKHEKVRTIVDADIVSGHHKVALRLGYDFHALKVMQADRVF